MVNYPASKDKGQIGIGDWVWEIDTVAFSDRSSILRKAGEKQQRESDEIIVAKTFRETGRGLFDSLGFQADK